MKSKNLKREAAALSTKSKVKIKNLKLAKETIETLPDAGSQVVKGGQGSAGGGSSNSIAPTRPTAY